MILKYRLSAMMIKSCMTEKDASKIERLKINSDNLAMLLPPDLLLMTFTHTIYVPVPGGSKYIY